MSGATGQTFKLKEMPQLRLNPNPALTIGDNYQVQYVDGSNFVVKDDNGDDISLGSCRFHREPVVGGEQSKSLKSLQ